MTQDGMDRPKLISQLYQALGIKAYSIGIPQEMPKPTQLGKGG